MTALAVAPTGEVLAGVNSSGRVVRISPQGLSPIGGGFGPVLAIAALSSSDLFFTVAEEHSVRRLSAGNNSSFVGGVNPGFNGDGRAPGQTTLTSPFGLAVLGGNLYVAERFGCRIRRVPLTPNATVSTLAGTGVCGSGPGELLNPVHLVTDEESLFAAEQFRVKRVSIQGQITPFAGTGFNAQTGDGGAPASAQLTQVGGLASEFEGRVYIVSPDRVRVVTSERVRLDVTSNSTGIFSASIDGAAPSVRPSTSVIPGIPHSVATPAAVPVSTTVRERFLQFTGRSSAGPSLTFVMPWAATVINAEYRRQFTLAVSITPAGGGRVSRREGNSPSAFLASAFHDEGSTVRLEAFPSDGFGFGSFTDGPSVSSVTPRDLQMNQAKTVAAAFNPIGGFVPIRLNMGGPTFVDDIGQTWQEQTVASPQSTTEIIQGTPNQVLYQTAGASSIATGTLRFNVPVPPNRNYNLRLKFADFVSTAPLQRLFHINVNGARVETNLDLFSQSGGRSRALDKLYSVTQGSASEMVVELPTAGRAILNALQVALVQIPSRAKFGNGRRLDRTRLRSRSQRGSPDLRHRRPCPA
ncbi:MAG: hypothetical protein FJW23_17635 [Acidimicrobiia bacterium]|nr:hypothetical protein [Acidimicrobiia bacterium]